MAEQLSPDRAIRLLRALAAELEVMVKLGTVDMIAVAGHSAIVAELLADEIERAAGVE